MPAMNRPGFFTKAGLKRFLTSDEVWTFGRKRSSGEQISADQDTLQTARSEESSDPNALSAYSYRSQPCHRTSFERKVKRKGVQPAHQPETHGYDHELEENIQCQLDKADSHEEVNTNDVSELRPGPGEKIQYPTDVTWKAPKVEHNFISEQISCRISDRAPIVSSFSSDIEEDLPYDYEDSNRKLGEITDTSLQGSLDCGNVITDNVTLNVQNSQQSQSALLNNNHRICDGSRKTESNVAYTQTHDPDSNSPIRRNTRESVLVKPPAEYYVQALSTDMGTSEESPSCDDSFSELEEKSEPFSLQSEALVWSEEEERDGLSEEKTDTFAEKFIVVPEASLYSHLSIANVGPRGRFQNETAESALSEILSPVDEVLSYGSADLPSVKGGSGSGLVSNTFSQPPPAFEIITWTSEEDLPAPPDFVEDISINSDNIPPLPVDVSLIRCDPGSLRETEVSSDVILKEAFITPPPAQPTESDQEDNGSEYTSSLPLDDPLSSFRIGDRVLVCNSRPGVLKYKGYPAFAGGFWAGVALDMPSGNHNGTFRGVKYFTCDKSHGVLVKSEDISHLLQEGCSDIDTGKVKDTVTNKDPTRGHDGKNDKRSSGNQQEWYKDSQSSSAHDSSAPKHTFQQEPCGNDAGRSNRSAVYSRSSGMSPLKVDRKLVCCNGENKDHAIDSKPLIERLTEEIFADTLKNAKEIGFKLDGIHKAVNLGKSEAASFRTNKPHLMDQWQQVCPVTPPQIWVRPHEHSIVYRLVDVTVDILFGLENEGALEACETPSSLIDDESRKMYRQVMFHLASDILHEVCADVLEISGSFQKTKDTPMISVLQTRHISVELLKTAVKRETQKVLNLERTDQQMTEMLQTLCKYWYAKRDKVDYILIQELHSEEKQWVDYSTDRVTVKIQLAEEIFHLLLHDTISVLNNIYCIHNK